MFFDCLRVVPQDGGTALTIAATWDYTKFGEMLVKAGADMEQTDNMVSHTHGGGGVTVRGVGIGGMGG